MAPSIAALRIQPLTTVLELEHAVVNAQQAGRLLVVKAYAPWCTACKVIEPKYKRAASSNLEVDFCEIDFVQAKALCKHCGVEKLPTGMIFKDGKKVEHSCVRSSEFSGFVSRIAEHADHAEHANAESEALALGARAGRTGRGTGDAARDDLFWESLSG
jgi:thioredoxin-like negative regulator of GroEL